MNNVYLFEPIYTRDAGGCILVAAKDKRKALRYFKEHGNTGDFEFIQRMKELKSSKEGIIYSGYCIL